MRDHKQQVYLVQDTMAPVTRVVHPLTEQVAWRKRLFKLSPFQSPSSNPLCLQSHHRRQHQAPTRSTPANSPKPRRERPSTQTSRTNQRPTRSTPPGALGPGHISRTEGERPGSRP